MDLDVLSDVAQPFRDRVRRKLQRAEEALEVGEFGEHQAPRGRRARRHLHDAVADGQRFDPAARGLPRPDVALAASAGVEWRGPRMGVGTRYVLERYDFPENAGDRRIEEMSVLRVWVSAFWSNP